VRNEKLLTDSIALFLLVSALVLKNSLVFAAASDAAVLQTFNWSGAFRNGLPEGRGVATFDDGRLFAGEMAAGLFTGNGTLTLPGGERYTGGFAAGQFQG